MSKKLDKLLRQLLKLHPKYIDLSLGRLNKLLNKLDNPQHKLPPTIHIAGTNGKGSTLSYIQHILMEHDLKVHAYISPHLQYFNERIILSNNEIKTQKLSNAIEFVKKINDNKPITFFEITTAVAFYLYSKEKADFLILETGLGGRLDATNVIKNSILNIITPIGIDHQEFLGKNIYKIVDEKLGIIKKNSTVIIGKQKLKIKTHIEKKLKNNNNCKYFYNKNFKIISQEKKYFVLKYHNDSMKFKYPSLNGTHQIENVSTAIASILRLNELGYKFTNKKINKGIIKTKWPGRLEEGQLEKIKVFLDGAHNIDGATKLYEYFKEKKIKIWLIIGMLNNKDLHGFLKILKPIINGVIAIKIPQEKNSFSGVKIKKNCDDLKLNCIIKSSILEANNYLLKEIRPKNILISGSLYLIGKIRKIYL